MPRYLSFYGGDRTIAIIKKYGLTPDRVKVVAGAAGGPKWLILGHMDRFLFSEWFKGRRTPLYLAGSSSGAWRFAALTRNDPEQGIEKLARAYIHQHYSLKPTLEEIDVECRKIIDGVMDGTALDEFFHHPYCRPTFFSVQAKGPAKSDHPLLLLSALAASAVLNAVDRAALTLFFRRVLFHHPADLPPFIHAGDFSPCRVSLTPANFKEALLSSGSIPVIMRGVKNIPDAPKGVYRDGGVIDYHLNIPFLGTGKLNNTHDSGFEASPLKRETQRDLDGSGMDAGTEKIVLFPHYTDRIVPGWLDKHLPWRQADRENLRHVLMVTPSREFVEMLPGGAIPERADFTRFKGKNKMRIQQWKLAWNSAERLGEELREVLSSNVLPEIIRPLW